jgi:hypothetical protein
MQMANRSILSCGLAFALCVASAAATRAQDAGYATAAKAKLASIGIDGSDIAGMEYRVTTEVGTGRVVGQATWVRLISCTGWVVLEMNGQFAVTAVRTEGDCKLPPAGTQPKRRPGQ